MDQVTKSDVLARLGRVAGQVGGIQRMVEDDRYCVDVLHQITAVRAALAKIGTKLLESHLETCVRHAFESDDETDREAKIAELVKVFEKSQRG